MADIDDDVLDAVARLLDEEGVRGLSISAIAERSKLSRVTLHRRGWTIDDYVVGVLSRASDDLRSSLWPALTAPGDAASRLRLALRTLCQVAERHAGVLSALFRVRPLPAGEGRTTSFEFVEPFQRLLQDGMIDGSLRTDDPAADATFLANAVAWTYLHMRQAHEWNPDRTADRAIDMAMAVLAPRD